MAKIIKTNEKPTPPPKKSPIMKGSLFREQQEIEALQAQTEQDRKKIISLGKQQAASAKEQAMTEGANQAFAEASDQALDIFVERAKYCLDLKGQLKQLTDEISKKILGGKLTLSEPEQDKILDTALNKLRSRHKLKIQVTDISQLEKLKQLPDFDIEAATDLPAGFLRITTEVGSSLWDDKTAISKITASTDQLLRQ
jgi:flagellar biosynthesis/type III secretory pathway protein FliH